MKITGKHGYASREFLRAWIHASATVLGYHGYLLDLESLRVDIKLLPDDTAGQAYMGEFRFEICETLCLEDAATTVLHECIHLACGEFTAPGRDTVEKCTSTLTAKLKPEVAQIAGVLLDGTYRRAAFFAHTKLAYRNAPGQPDCYDRSQENPVGVTDKYMRGKRDGH